MRMFCLRVYSFVICVSLLSFFGTYFALLGTTLGFPWPPLGCPWVPLRRLGLQGDSPWCHFELPLAPFGCHCAPFRHLGPPRGALVTLGRKRIQFSEHILSVCDARAQIIELSGTLQRILWIHAEFARNASEFTSKGSEFTRSASDFIRKSGARAAAPNPTSRAGG